MLVRMDKVNFSRTHYLKVPCLVPDDECMSYSHEHYSPKSQVRIYIRRTHFLIKLKRYFLISYTKHRMVELESKSAGYLSRITDSVP